MKNSVRAVGTVFAAAILLAGCSPDGEQENTGSAAEGSNAPEGLATAGVLTACIDPEYAPLEYYENGSTGEIIGFDADSIRALATLWGVEAKMEVTAFDGLMPALQSGRCDILFSGLYMSEERLAVADAAPVMNAGPAILAAPERAASITAPEDLCGLTVAAQAASANAASIAKLSETCVADGAPKIAVTEYPKTAETVLAVINGKADALIETNVAAAYMVTQNSGQLEVAADIFPPDTTFGVFTRKDDPLSPAVAEGLKTLHDDGTLEKIAGEYNLAPSLLDVSASS